MTRFLNFTSATFPTVLFAALVALSGCASKPTAKSTVESMTAFGNETAEAKDSIDTAVKALDTLGASQASQIKTNLDAYSKAVAALENQAKVVRANADKMKAQGDAFFKEWEGSEKISPQRRSELSASYAKIKSNMLAARDSFTPFLASLKDVQGYVSMDPTLKGTESMGGMVQKANANATEVKSRIDDVLNDVNSVRGMLSTKAK